jgi:type IV pilus assembly protein PilA
MVKRAFTLIELIVVVAIIGVLASIGVLSYNNFIGSGKDAAIKAQHQRIHDFIDVNLTTKCLNKDSRFTISGTAGLQGWPNPTRTIYCNYTNPWQTVCEIAQSFRQFHSALYLRNPIDNSHASDYSRPGGFTIYCEAQGNMSFQEWVNKGSPHSIIILSKLSDDTEYKTYIPKKWR